MLGTAGLSLSDLLRQEVRAAASGKPAKRRNSVIILWMRGGPSHIDMWDPKPLAPAEYRGEFGTIDTRVPGIQLGDLLPMSAKVMDQWSIIRSLNHEDAGHSTGDQICFTGYPAGPSPDENVRPSCGSIVARQLGHLQPDLPAYVMIPRMVPGTNSAYLGVAYKPFETQADPAAARPDGSAPFRVPNFEMASGLTLERLGDRRELRASLDSISAELDRSGHMEAMDRFS